MNSASLLILATMPLMFIAIWCFTLFFISAFSGWSKLARRYASTRLFTGTVYPFQSARMRQARYNNSLKVGADQTGLYLAPVKIFRPYHKPLLIPWSEIQARSRAAGRPDGYRLTFPSVPGVTLDLNREILEDIAGHLTSRPGG